MDFRTIVDVGASDWTIEPCERMLFVGSCFADNMGKRFREEKFRAVTNPYGVMYNPASILHTVSRLTADGAMPFKADEPGTAVFTLGTNHVYILNETGEIVDNCRKRPQNLFTEKELTVDECADYLRQAVCLIHDRYPLVRFVLTVSPIRYRKYGFHGSQLSKATLLLAIQNSKIEIQNSKLPNGDDSIGNHKPQISNPRPQIAYFPSYEIMNDELRDYRFYKPDMLHPSEQAVEYIFERFGEVFFSDATREFLREWKPIKEALAHRPFHPDSEEYRRFVEKTKEKYNLLKTKYMALDEDGL